MAVGKIYNVHTRDNKHDGYVNDYLHKHIIDHHICDCSVFIN